MNLKSAEYIFLLGLYNPSTVLGVENPYANASHAASEKAMAEAMESLQAQGLIEIHPGGEISVEAHLAGLIATCAFPEVSLIATYTDTLGTKDLRIVHFATPLIVEDAVLPEGEHRLTRIQPGEVTGRIADQFRLADKQAAPGEPCSVHRDAFEAARDIARASGPATAARRLQEAGVETTTATLLAEALAEPTSNAALMLIQAESPQAGQSIGILEAAHGLWRLRVIDPARIEAAPCDGAEVARYVAEIVARAEARVS